MLNGIEIFLAQMMFTILCKETVGLRNNIRIKA